jgi:uncharacterized protein YjbI with pentapeptide repeats
LVPFITALVAVATFATQWSKQRYEARVQRDAELQQRRREVQQDFDLAFAKAVENLGSSSVGLQASAVASLLIYLERYEEYRGEILILAAANLKIRQLSPVVRDLLVRLLAQALRVAQTVDKGSGGWSARDASFELDLSGVIAPGLDLSKANLDQWVVDLSNAQLSGSTLRHCHLWKMAATGLQFDDAIVSGANLGQTRLDGCSAVRTKFKGVAMTSASVRSADLRFTDFTGASLQSAHFDHCDLRGARFTGANVNDAYFKGARFDRGALESLLRSDNLEKAHFDPEAWTGLQSARAASVGARL